MFIFLLILLVTNQSNAEKYRIFFKDKGDGNFYRGSYLYKLAENSISERSKHRRLKAFPKDSIVTFADIPINIDYLKKIKAIGGEIRLALKWLNYVVVEIEPEKIRELYELPFVRNIQKVSEKIPKNLLFNSIKDHDKLDLKKEIFLDVTENEQYGESYNQLKMLSIDKLHSFGILGDGVLVGLIDSGFRWKKHKGFNNIKVVAEYDFLNNDTICENQDGDEPSQDAHGTMVFSIIGGYLPGQLIGSAPFSNFVLSKTESIPFESHFEEDCLAAALEWMDSIGVDIISSSLGYFRFDSTDENYFFNDLNGKSTLVSAYANFAQSLGIILVSSAGNKGPADSTIQAPADAIGEIAIGAVNSSGDSVLKFSSRGPTADGRIKPEFLAQGISVISLAAGNPDTIIKGTGTSVACPIFAGGVACLLSAFEELSPEKVTQLLQNYSSNKDNPNNTFGWGVPDFFKSAINYDILISNPITFPIGNYQRIIFKTKFKYPINKMIIFIKGVSEPSYTSFLMNYSEYYDFFYYDLSLNDIDSIYYFYVTAESIDGKARRKPFNTESTFVLKFGEKSQNADIALDNNFILLSRNKSENSTIILPTVLKTEEDLFFDTPTINSDWLKVSIFNLFGEVLFEKIFETQPNRRFSSLINLGYIAKGTYFLVIYRKGNKPETFKFIKI